MASNYGFVYVLRNICMPGIYKIGMTDRAPSQRAEELSSSTSVPMPFDLVCFAEVMDAASVERAIHEELDDRRVNPAREFFALTGEDVRNLISTLTEESSMVAVGDTSFLYDGGKCGGPIGRALKDIFSASLSAERQARIEAEQ